MKIDSDKMALSTCLKETFNKVADDWANSIVKVGIYALPAIGFIARACESCYRLGVNGEGLVNTKIDHSKQVTRLEAEETVRDVTRTFQANDALYVVASLVSLVVFSGMGFGSVGAVFAALAPTMFYSVIMFVHAQSVYHAALTHIGKSIVEQA